MILKPTRSHLSRLMKIWRSAGWPSRDPIDIDLLAAGWVSRVGDHPAQECLRLTDAGIAVLAQSRQAQRRVESDHDKLALRMSDLLTASGRLVWRELSLRARIDEDTSPQEGNLAALTGDVITLWRDDTQDAGVDGIDNVDDSEGGGATNAAKAYRWRMTRPDLFSVRRTSNPAYLQPMVHEVKVSRADLLSDLRHTAKRASYQWLCSECHYVFPHGVAEPQELPEELGVWVIHGDIEAGHLEMLRPARHSPRTIPFGVWMAMAKDSPVRSPLEFTQAELAEADEPPTCSHRQELSEPGLN